MFLKTCQLLLVIFLLALSKTAVYADWNTDLVPPSNSVNGSCEGGSLLKQPGTTQEDGVTTYSYNCPGTYANLILSCGDNRGCIHLIYNTGSGDTDISLPEDPSFTYSLSSSFTNSPNPHTITITSVDGAGNRLTNKHKINFTAIPDPTSDLRVDTESKTVTDTTFTSLAKSVTISSTAKAYLYWRTTGLGPNDTCLGSWITSQTKNVATTGNATAVGPYTTSKQLGIDCFQASTGKTTSSSVTVNIIGTSPAPTPTPSPTPPPTNTCPGTCGPSNGPPSQYQDTWNGTCLNSQTNQRGWWSWDGMPANSSCTSNTDAYCYTCKTVSSSPAPSPSPGQSLPRTIRQIFNGPFLWGKIYKDAAGTGQFSGNPILGNTELNNSLLSPQTSSVTALGGPNSIITAYTPNVMRGALSYYVNYSGNHLNPAVITRTFTFNGISGVTNRQPVTTASTVTDNKPNCTNGYDNTRIDTVPVSGSPGLVKVTTQHNIGGGTCTPSNETNIEYQTKTASTLTCTNGCTIQAVPNYQTFKQFASELSTGSQNSRQYYYGIDGNFCLFDYAPICQSGCNNAPNQICQKIDGQYYSSCQSDCTASCNPNPNGGYTFSCSGNYNQAGGWTIYRGTDSGSDSNGSFNKNTAFGFKKNGVQQATITYSNLKISNPLTGPTDLQHGQNPGSLFDDSWTDSAYNPNNPYCSCNQDPSARPNCTQYGYTCNSLPARNEYRFMPPGDYQFKITSNYQMSLTVKVNGSQFYSGTAAPDGSGKLTFNFVLPNSVGAPVEMILSTAFTDPNNLPAVTVGTPELYPLGYYEASFSTDSSVTYTNWCAAGLDMNGKPSPWPNLTATQTTDNIQCGGNSSPDFVLSNRSTSLDTYKIIEADLLLSRRFDTVTGRLFLDRNKNGLKDSGASEPYVSAEGVTTVTGTPGFVLLRESADSYSVRNMKPGNYSIGFNPNPPYTISFPPGMSAFNVTVGPSCQVPQSQGRNIGQCTPEGDIINLDIGLSPPNPCAWIQTAGDVHSNIIINTPCGP